MGNSILDNIIPNSSQEEFDYLSPYMQGCGITKEIRDLLNLPHPSRSIIPLTFDIMGSPNKLFLYKVATKDAGVIPAIFGSIDFLPLNLESAIKEVESLLNKGLIPNSNLEVVRVGHLEARINNLQEYEIPKRVARSYNKFMNTGEFLEFREIGLPEIDSLPNIVFNAMLETILTYEGIDISTINTTGSGISGTTFYSQSDYEKCLGICKKYLAFQLKRKQGTEHKYLLHTLNKKPFALSSIQVSDGKWSWINTDRLRDCSKLTDIKSNLNDAHIVSMIRYARSQGAKSFDLGIWNEGLYDYKLHYNPTILPRPGLRFKKDMEH